jgi:hypothetical protein
LDTGIFIYMTHGVGGMWGVLIGDAMGLDVLKSNKKEIGNL